MRTCTCGGMEFRAVQKAYLSVIVDANGKFLRDDSPDGKANITDCDPPAGLTCTACGRDYESPDDLPWGASG